MIAKSTAIKDRGGRSGGRAEGGRSYLGRSASGPGVLGLRPSRGGLTAAQKSAEGIVGGSDPGEGPNGGWQIEQRSRECQIFCVRGLCDGGSGVEPGTRRNPPS